MESLFKRINEYPVGATIPDVLLESFLTAPITPTTLQLLDHMFCQSRVDPVKVFVACVIRLQDEWDLYAACLCLRNGVDPNVYVYDSNDYIHIFVSLLQAKGISKLEVIAEDSLLWRLIVILKLKGLSLELPLIGVSNFPETKTVSQYFSDIKAYEAVPSSIDQIDGQNNFYFRALLGLPDESAAPLAVTEPQYKFLVKSRTYTIMKDLLSFHNIISVVEMDSVMPVLALEYSNEDALLDYVKTVSLISYPLTNSLCLKCRGTGLISKIWEETVVACVAHGLPLDYFQYELLKSGIKNEKHHFLKQLQTAYKDPYWQKFFRIRKQRDYLPCRLSLLLKTVCGSCPQGDLERIKTTLEQLSAVSEEHLEQLVLDSERLKLTLKCSCMGQPQPNIQDFLLYGCDENPLLLRKPYRVFFCDNGKFYAICSDRYKNVELIQEVQELDEFVRLPLLDKIARNLITIQEETGNPAQPETIVKYITRELASDRITDAASQVEMARLFITEALPIQTVIYQGIYNLTQLSPDHAQATLAFIKNFEAT